MQKLKDIIKRRKNDADLNPNKWTQQVELSSGLRFRIKRINDRYMVVLSRSGKKPPSEVEVETFNQCWPTDRPIKTEDYRAAVIYELTER